MAQVWLPARRRAWLAAVVRISARGVWARGAFSPRLLTIGRDGERSRPAARPATEQADARQAQFERWFAQYRLPLLDYLYGMTRDREWAADLVQEAFLRAYAASSDPDAIGQPRAWLYRIATNTFLSQKRKDKRERPLDPLLDDHLAVTNPDQPASLDARDLLVEVEQFVQTLPEKQRVALILRKYHELDYANIAATLNSSEEAARANVYEALRKLRTCFGDRL